MAATPLSDILDNLNQYANFEESGSVSRAKSFITAAVQFLSLPSSQASQGESLGYSPEMVKQQLEYARAFVRANDTASSAVNAKVRFFDVSNTR